ncbi:outer membrane beta-barrel protein [Cytophagaceae bacterium ABcell3]|nr:outer membrane beta-barrel protein [Cytophagaceae bacterium ABcell3]
MKKLFLVLAAIFLVSLESFSQIGQGQWMLGGSLSLNGRNSSAEMDGTNSYFNAGLSARAGYFVSDNIAIGMSPGYSFLRSASDDLIAWDGYMESNVYTRHLYNASPFIRVYKQLFNSRAYLFGQGSLDFFHMRSSSGRDQTSSRTIANSIGASIAPGVNFFVHDKIALEVLFGGLSSRYERSIRSGDNLVSDVVEREFQYNFSLNLRSLRFGLIFFL